MRFFTPSPCLSPRHCCALAVAACLVSVPTATAQVFDNVAPGFGIAGVAGSSGTGIGGGLSTFDANNDGLRDLVYTPPTSPPLLFLRTASGYAIDEWSLIPSTPPGEALGSLPFDADGDGDQDLLLLRAGQNVLFRNDNGVLTDVSASHLPGTSRWSTSAAAGDIDGDGDDDVWIADYIDGIAFP
ncbi:MAG: hypothetical protein ACI9WU_002166, partial [Myxococcota bacterium]